MLFNISTTIFNLNGNFYFLSILIFWITFCSLPQNSKIAEKENGSNRNSITQCPILMKIVTNIKNNIVYKLIQIFSLFLLYFFNFWITLQNTLIGCALVTMATKSKIAASLFCVYCSHVSTPQIWCQSVVSFLFGPVFSQSEALFGYHGNQSKITTIFHN